MQTLSRVFPGMGANADDKESGGGPVDTGRSSRLAAARSGAREAGAPSSQGDVTGVDTEGVTAMADDDSSGKKPEARGK